MSNFFMFNETVLLTNKIPDVSVHLNRVY